MIYLMYLLILVLTIILIIIIEDKKKALKLTGILTGSSGIILLSLILILKLIIDNSIFVINISSITNNIFNKFLYNSIILFIISLIEIILCKYIKEPKTITHNTKK